MRDHSPIVLDNFKGLWQRGDPENTPLDHFQACNNVVPIGNKWRTRDGIDLHQDVLVPLKNVVRIYNYPTTTANTLLVLVINDAGSGEIYHVVNSTTIYGPILTVATMTDFAFVPYAGRAYITPFTSFVTGDLNIQKGISGEFLYVYLGAGIAARKAAGSAPTGNITIANGAVGYTDPGLKVFGVVFESDTGWLSVPGVLETFTTVAGQSVSFGTIPVGDSSIVKRHIVVSQTITSFNGNLEGYQLFFLPDGTINNNTDIFINNLSWYDQALLEDASHLFDNYSEIPAGCALSLYHDRLCLSTTFNDISIVLVSAQGEPEAISQIDGLLIVPPDGNPITNHAALRDVLYVFKRSRTIAYVDDGTEPSNWKPSVIDNAYGTCVHGIATVLDSGNASVDFFIVATYAGIVLFNGRYILPELSWKISELWAGYDRNEYRLIQIINAAIQKWILIVTPRGEILCGDYADGMDPKNIQWAPWPFEAFISCIAIVNIDEIIIGANFIPPTYS
jgi:hypothetical protein